MSVYITLLKKMKPQTFFLKKHSLVYDNKQLMVAPSPTRGSFEAETGIVVRDEVEPNNTCCNNSSYWAISFFQIILFFYYSFFNTINSIVTQKQFVCLSVCVCVVCVCLCVFTYVHMCVCAFECVCLYVFTYILFFKRFSYCVC